MMSDVELVIRIDEEVYKYILSMQFFISGLRSGKSLLEKILKAIRTGTPLTKGHGRLIDEERISLSGIHFKTELDHARMIGRLNSALTIIEADKGEI